MIQTKKLYRAVPGNHEMKAITLLDSKVARRSIDFFVQFEKIWREFGRYYR